LPSLFTQLSKLRRLHLSRFFVGDLLEVHRYLSPTIQLFTILGAFTEDIQDLADQGTLRASGS
jgi:hypothetical protein